MRLLTTAVSALAIGSLASPGARAGQCKAIDTTIVTTLSACAPDFPSPVGLCTVGVVGSGRLAGSTRFRALTLTPTASEFVLLYTGELVITTRSGTLTLRDYGVLDLAAGRFFEVQNVVAGTGTFRRATGRLTSQGTTTGVSFAGSLTGSICRSRHRDRDRDDRDRDDRDRDDRDHDDHDDGDSRDHERDEE
jgi:hypothetical protein